MIRQDIFIKRYWHVIVFYQIRLDKKIKGFTQTDYDKRLSIVAIGKTDNKEDFFNTIIHEAKHVQSHICKYYGVKEDGEQSAYLIGYLTMKMFRVFKKLI
ncbi:MAG: hypothetical protein IJ213_04890 [Bacteroidales bacterium]|nr:hypothetical protein [Bacteroidales bacterium]MBQ9312366.1 hypothetical protein [Bacteroidales bacterium]